MSGRLFAVTYLCVVLLVCATVVASTVYHKPSNCEEFSEGVTFNATQANGTWHLVHCWSIKGVKCVAKNCLEFQIVTPQEQESFYERLDSFVPNMTWTSLELKMKIPCHAVSNRSNVYHLETMDDMGAFKTLQILSSKASVPVSSERSLLKMKIIKEKYLAMMDCGERYMFLFIQSPLLVDQLEYDIQRMIADFDFD